MTRRCSKGCIPCTQAAERAAGARRDRLAGWLIQLVAVVPIGFAFLVEGLPAAALAISGVALLWVGWYLIVRASRQVIR